MTGPVPRLQHRGRHLFTGLADACQHVCRDLEPGWGGDAAAHPQPRLPGAPGLASPLETARAQPARRDGVPLRTARRLLTSRDAQTQGSAQVARPLGLPQVWTTTGLPPAAAPRRPCVASGDPAGPGSGPQRARPPPTRGSRRRANVAGACVARPIPAALGRPMAAGVGPTSRPVDGVRLLPPAWAGVCPGAQVGRLLGIDPAERGA
jgi:hypothetical protein